MIAVHWLHQAKGEGTPQVSVLRQRRVRASKRDCLIGTQNAGFIKASGGEYRANGPTT
jgi:hypothetical protein